MTCSNCGEITYMEGNFCRKCGTALVDTAALTVPITETTGQVTMDENDILIEIKRELNQQKAISFVIIYDEVDRECKLPPGSTKQ
jgi:hypothetical protein